MTVGYSFNIWVPLLLFPTVGPNGAPRWRKGWPVTFVFFFLLLMGFLTSIFIDRRYVFLESGVIYTDFHFFVSEKRRLVAESVSDDGAQEREEIVVKLNSNSKNAPQVWFDWKISGWTTKCIHVLCYYCDLNSNRVFKYRLFLTNTYEFNHSPSCNNSVRWYRG